MSRPRGSKREYPREVQVGEELRRVVGRELERIDDDRLLAVVLTSIDVDRELTLAIVYYDDASNDPSAAEQALEDHRRALQSAVNNRTRLRRTPRLEFRIDPAIETGSRVDEILSGLEIPPESDDDPA